MLTSWKWTCMIGQKLCRSARTWSKQARARLRSVCKILHVLLYYLADRDCERYMLFHVRQMRLYRPQNTESTADAVYPQLSKLFTRRYLPKIVSSLDSFTAIVSQH